MPKTADNLDIWSRLSSSEPFFIADIGKNFIQTKQEQSPQTYIKNACDLINAAAFAGAHAVKFQTHTYQDEQYPIEVKSPHFKSSDRFGWVKRNTLTTPISFWQILKKYTEQKGLIFFSTPMSRQAAILLNSLSVPLWKIGSGDILDFVMLDYIRRTPQPIIISSGMSSLSELTLALNFIREKNQRIALMYCVSQYPCPDKAINLNTLLFLKKQFNLPIGFSDHSIGSTASLASIKLGAQLIEKHFSFSRHLWGSDHKVSMTPPEFKKMVALNNTNDFTGIQERKFMGRPCRGKLNDEKSEFRQYFRKTLVASQNLPAGTIIKPEHLYAMRPQAFLSGLPSEAYPHVVGQTTATAIKRFDPVKSEHLIPIKEAAVA